MTSLTGKPIVIADYDPAWPHRFEAERELIVVGCGADAFVKIEHVGSTAVPGLGAKPIIDIMPGVRTLADVPPLVEALASIGYQYVPEFEDQLPERRYFRKDVDGVRAFHMHIVEKGSDFWVRHLLFRNALRALPPLAAAYETLKRGLASQHGADREGYTEAKTQFVEAVEALARQRVARRDPIVIVEYDPAWQRLFEREREAIARVVGDAAVAIEHVGSTAVPGLSAKPVIDIAIGVRDMEQRRTLVAPLRASGYITHGDQRDRSDWIIFRKDDAGARLVNLHVVPFDGWRWQQYIRFRGYLRAHDDVATNYSRLKRELAAEYGRDMIGYTEAKSDFVIDVYRAAGAPERPE